MARQAYCMGVSGIECGPYCGQWDVEHMQCAHVTTAQMLAGILDEMRKLAQRRTPPERVETEAE